MLILLAVAFLFGIPLLILNGWAASVLAGWFIPELGLSTVEGIGASLILSIIHTQPGTQITGGIPGLIEFYLSRAITVLLTLVVGAATYALVAS